MTTVDDARSEGAWETVPGTGTPLAHRMGHGRPASRRRPADSGRGYPQSLPSLRGEIASAILAPKATPKPDSTPMPDPNLSSFIWSVADLLRGDYKQSEYGRVILPFTVLRRLDCVLESTKPAVLEEFDKLKRANLHAAIGQRDLLTLAQQGGLESTAGFGHPWHR